MVLVVGTGTGQGEIGSVGGCPGQKGEGRWDTATDVSKCVCVCLSWQEGAALVISSLLSGLSHLVPMAQLAPALTIRNPWDNARKTGWCSKCACVCMCIYSRNIETLSAQTHHDRICSMKHKTRCRSRT